LTLITQIINIHLLYERTESESYESHQLYFRL
jgi:hypothetical protein